MIADKSSCEQGTCGFENTHREIRAARPLKLFPRGDGRRTVLIETSVHQFWGWTDDAGKRDPPCRQDKLTGNRARTGLNDKRCEVDESVTGVT
jgi:hypothetical protein